MCSVPLIIFLSVYSKIRNRCGILLCHSMLLRRDELCHARLADMFVHSFEEAEGKNAIALAIGKF
jgi:hypothetical protein